MAAIVRQSYDNYGASTSVTDHPFTITQPSAGEIILVAFCFTSAAAQSFTSVKDQNGDDFTAIQTRLHGGTGSVDAGLWYKTAEGDETEITLIAGVACVGEYACAVYSDMVVPADNSSETETNVTTVVTSQPSGSATPGTATGVFVAVNCVTESRRWDTTDSVSVSGDATLVSECFFTANRGGIVWADDVYTASGAKSATFVTGSTGSACYSIAAAFQDTGGGIAVPVFMHAYNSMRGA